jgi:hypothetical protein
MTRGHVTRDGRTIRNGTVCDFSYSGNILQPSGRPAATLETALETWPWTRRESHHASDQEEMIIPRRPDMFKVNTFPLFPFSSSLSFFDFYLFLINL